MLTTTTRNTEYHLVALSLAISVGDPTPRSAPSGLNGARPVVGLAFAIHAKLDPQSCDMEQG
jgi:hypothetical protein